MSLFHFIFGRRDEGDERIPEELIERATEHAVDGTDSRLRLLSGYKRHLREPVIHAIDHVMKLVDAIPAPLAVGRNQFTDEPAIAALYASAAAMLDHFGRDRSLANYLDGAEGRWAEQVTALLLAERSERTVYGIELKGELLRREVPQTAISFSQHNVVEPAVSEEAARHQLKRRAFEHLLYLALTRIGEVSLERTNLTRQRDLLRSKLAALKRGGWCFNPADSDHPDPTTLQAELDGIGEQLVALGTDDTVLQSHLEIVAQLLGEAEKQLWAENVILYIDRMNIQREPQDPAARQVALQELHNLRDHPLAMLLVSFAPAELPPREDLVTAAQRYLY
jgi:hypothetical protein